MKLTVDLHPEDELFASFLNHHPVLPSNHVTVTEETDTHCDLHPEDELFASRLNHHPVLPSNHVTVTEETDTHCDLHPKVELPPALDHHPYQ